MENKSSFLKDAIESITTLANKAKDPKTLEYNGHLYLIDESGNANRIWEPKNTPQRKRVCSLDALVALIKHEAVDRYATNAHPLFVNCESFDYNYANYAQALARIHRIGQHLPVTYIHLVVDGSIDEKILAALENKEDMAKTVVDSWREVLTAPEKRRNP